jgi:hypothetical protein
MTAPVQNAAAAATAKPSSITQAIFSASTGMPGIFKSNFDYQLARAMPAGAYGEGGAVGEVFSTARRISEGDLEGWAVAWTETAKRIEGTATDCLRGRHVVWSCPGFVDTNGGPR